MQAICDSVHVSPFGLFSSSTTQESGISLCRLLSVPTQPNVAALKQVMLWRLTIFEYRAEFCSGRCDLSAREGFPQIRLLWYGKQQVEAAPPFY